MTSIVSLRRLFMSGVVMMLYRMSLCDRLFILGGQPRRYRPRHALVCTDAAKEDDVEEEKLHYSLNMCTDHRRSCVSRTTATPMAQHPSW